MKTLKQKWGGFAGMILDPWFAIFVLLTLAALSLSIAYKEDTLFSNLLAVFGSITGGIAGGIFQSEHAKSSGENILRKKGQSAVRNLQSIQKQIGSLRGWILSFIKGSTKDAQKQLGEIDRHLSIIELNVNSGYEDWIDIDPALRGEKEVHEKYAEVFRSYAKELLDQRMKLAQAASASEKTHLEGKISAIEKQIKELKKEKSGVLSDSSPLSGGRIVFGPQSSVLTGLAYPELECESCGKKYKYDLAQPLSITLGNVCPECRTKAA